MARAMFVVFFGPEGEDSYHAHESPLLMTGVLSVLAVLAVGFGWIAFNWPGSFDGFGSFVFYDHAEKFHFGPVLGAISIVLAVGAFVLAWLVYVRRSVSHEPCVPGSLGYSGSWNAGITWTKRTSGPLIGWC